MIDITTWIARLRDLDGAPATTGNGNPVTITVTAFEAHGVLLNPSCVITGFGLPLHPDDARSIGAALIAAADAYDRSTARKR